MRRAATKRWHDRLTDPSSNAGHLCRALTISALQDPADASPAQCSVTDTPWSTFSLRRQLVGRPSSGKQLEEQKSPQALFCAPVVPESMKQNVEAHTSVLVSLCSSPTGAAQALS